MTDFLLELRSEEIPARMQKGARGELEKLFRREIEAAGVAVGEIIVWSTPRRLALIAQGLPTETEAVSEEAKGPPEGAPDQAIDGFCRKNGVTRDQLEVRDVKGRNTYFAVIEKPGRAVSDLLAEAIPAIIRDFAWPKSMRWGDASMSTESLRWVRPLSGIVALLGDEIVECEVHGVTSGAVTLGHRFHHSGDITIGNAADYAVKLRAGQVIVDHAEREAIIREGATKAASAAGLDLVEDEGLVVENAGLTEWPVPLLGWFDEAFLEVPPEVIQLTARVNQKYFVCTKPSPLQGRGGSREAAEGEGESAQSGGSPLSPTLSPEGEGDLANAFICTANIEAEDGGAAIVDGNRKVLAARLADARFFWDVDRKKTLAQHAEGLERITFHEKLGTVADKVERVAKLARWLVEEGIILPETGRGTSEAGGGARSAAQDGEGSDQLKVPLHHPTDGPPPPVGEDRERLADLAEQAARLCKADLVTEMVGEFPELQGLMGGYYARAEGLPDEVADAIRDHYKPVGQGDDVPTAPVTVAVSLADKLDTIAGFFLIGEKPTGSKDPFAQRRAALGVLELVLKNQLRMETMHFFARAAGAYQRQLEKRREHQGQWDDGLGKLFTAEFYGAVTDFVFDRLKVQQRANGIRHDLIDSVFSIGDDQPVRLLARVHALQGFVETADGTNLLAGYKRAANILKKEEWPSNDRHPGLDPGSRSASEAPEEAGPRLGGRGDGVGEKPLSYTPENAEEALIDALDAAGPKGETAIEAEDFAAAMAALASLRAPIDSFFDEVTVNDDDPAKRAARLDLLARFRDAVHRVADFSRIEG